MSICHRCHSISHDTEDCPDGYAIKRLIAEAVEKEREACAKIIESWAGMSNNQIVMAAAIRARGEKP